MSEIFWKASLDTGDLVFFDRPCLKMGGFFGAAICAAAKVVGGVPFDHIGVVVKDEKGLNVMVEASFSGVAVRPLCERVRRSSASQICVRRLQAHRTEEMREEARRFVSEVSHLPYKEGSEGLLQMVSAAFRFHPAKEQRRRVHAETVALSASIASLEKELELIAKPETGGDAAVRVDATKERLRRAITRRRRALVYLAAAGAAPEPSGRPPAAAAPPPPSTPPPEENAAAATSTTSASAAAPSDDSLPSRQAPIGPVAPHSHTPLSPSPPPPPAEPFDGGLFCSELVAALYQRLGLLDAGFPARHDYVPADFAQSLGHPVDCLGAVDLDEDTGGGGDGATGNGERSSGEETPSRRRHPDAEEGGSSSCPAKILPPPTQIPEGGGRVALLRGAALGPGRWLRGGPPGRPSPPTPTGKGGGGGGGEGDVDRRGGRGPSATPAANTPPVSQSTIATYAAAAASDEDGDDAASSDVAGGGDGDVCEFVGTGKGNGERGDPLLGGMPMTALRQRPQQQQQQQQQRDGGGGGTWWRSRLLLPQQQSLGSLSLLPGTRIKATAGAAAAAAAAASHRMAPPSSCSRWRPPPPPLGRSVGSGDGVRGRGRPLTWEPPPAAAAAARTAIDRVDAERRHCSSWPPSSLQPFVIVTTAAAVLAVSKKNLVKPKSLSRSGGVEALAMVLGGVWACADPLGIAGCWGTEVDGGGRAGLELDELLWRGEGGQRRRGFASVIVG
ncbi:unnamed protein product [Ectocarpus sp. CCAP 1310/34]|nr:unnamed protein product [Ectocarpus sp. CCAP 1310/34]